MENEDYEEVRVEGETFSEDDSNEEVEIEVTEISLNEDEINYWVSQLEELRERRGGEISLSLDEESELVITYDETSDDEDEEEEDEDSDDEDSEDEEDESLEEEY